MRTSVASSAFLFAAVVGCASLMTVSAAQAAYTNDFESDTTASWTVNKGPATTDAATNFFFDYSTVGIPAAPSGAGFRGAKFQANQSAGVFGGVTASPTGLTDASSVFANYTVTFDWWANFNGPFPAGGSGSTQLSTFGVGTSGTTSQWPGGVQDSIWFGGTTDGNSAQDWRAYSPTASTSYTPVSGVFAGGTGVSPDVRNNTHPYYASFGNVAAPAAQTALFPQQTGTTLVGSASMEWHQVEIRKAGGNITWTVDGLLIATVPAAHDTVAGGANIFFGHADTNATSSSDPFDGDLLFTLIDNVNVVPEPASLALLGFGGLMLRRRRN